MFIGRTIRLILVALLAIGLGEGVTLGGAQPFAGTGQAALSAPPNPGDCGPCQGCAKPCVTPIMCGAVCFSLGLASTLQGVAFHAHLRRLAPEPDWQLPSADLRIPTPPPRLSRFV
jgi:hypothetical protein